MNFRADINIRPMLEGLSTLAQDAVPRAAANAVNDMAKFFAMEMATEMNRTFDNTTPFVKNSFKTTRGKFGFRGPRDGYATKKRMRAIVMPGFGVPGQSMKGGDPLERIQSLLSLQIRGGERSPIDRAFTLPSPGKGPAKPTPLNRYGNIKNKYVKTQLARKDVFVGGPQRSARNSHHLPPGIYQRINKQRVKKGEKRKSLRALAFFEPENTNYKRNLAMVIVAGRVIKYRFRGSFNTRLTQQMNFYLARKAGAKKVFTRF